MRKNSEEISCLHCNARAHSIFKGLGYEEANHLDGLKACTKIKKGQFIFSENGYPQGLYCINHGKVKLIVQGNSGKRSEEHTSELQSH